MSIVEEDIIKLARVGGTYDEQLEDPAGGVTTPLTLDMTDDLSTEPTLTVDSTSNAPLSTVWNRVGGQPGLVTVTDWGATVSLFGHSPNAATQWYLGVFTESPNDDGNAVISFSRDGEGFGMRLGFFEATPVAKPTGVAVDAASIHAALVSLGLIAA